MMTYTTIQGDTWDSLSYKMYGDEKYMDLLIEANLDYAEVLIFSPGVVLTIPTLPEEEDDYSAIWRKL